jgi:predicted aldo/keto reductase-like oxidoreductase
MDPRDSPLEELTFESVVRDWKGKMEMVNFGTSGLRVSKIALGCMSFGDKRWNEWVLEEEEALPVIGAAYQAGINFFDTYVPRA